MKKNVRLLMGIAILGFALSGTSAKAYSAKDLPSSEDNRYCYYQGRGKQEINDAIMDDIDTANTGDGMKFTFKQSNGAKKYYIVINGEKYTTVDVSKKNKVTIELKKKEINGKQVQIYRNTDSGSNPICRVGEGNRDNKNQLVECKSGHSAKTCAVGYFNTFNDDYVLQDSFDDLISLEESRNYKTGKSTITISRKKDTASVKHNGKLITAKFNVITYQYDNSGKLEKIRNASLSSKSSKNNYQSISFSISPRGAESTLYYQITATSGEAKGAILTSGEEQYTGYERNTLVNSETCESVRKIKNWDKLKKALPECDASNGWLNYGANESESKLKSKVKVINKISETLTSFEVGNATLDGKINKTSSNRTKETLYCKFNQEKNQTKTYTYNTYEDKVDGYFTKICTESVQVTFDSPKLVSTNGGGFKYDVTVTPTVSCYAKINDDAWEKLISVATGKQCTVKHGCWGPDYAFTNYRDQGQWDGGPSEEFDSCVKTCDGGKYSQSCINKCYDEVYTNKATSNTNYTENVDPLKISYTGKLADNYDKYTKGWCIYPFKDDIASGDGDTFTAKKHNSSGQAISGTSHAGTGKYQCIAVTKKNSNGKKEDLYINRYYRTSSCGSTCYTTLTNGKKTKKYKETGGDGRVWNIGLTVDENQYNKDLNCYLNTSTEEVLDEKKIDDFINKWITLQDEVKQINSGEYEGTRKTSYVYKVRDSQEKYCDDTKTSNYKVYDNVENPLYITETNKKSSETSGSSKLISLGFPKACIKNGTITNKEQGKCCTTEDGVDASQRFYMSYTTEDDINHIANWPTDEKANFEADEKKSINLVKEYLKTKHAGKAEETWPTPTSDNKITITNGNITGKDEDNKYKDKNYTVCEGDNTFIYNIQAFLKNIGVLGKDDGWNFDINCFYGYYNTGLNLCEAQVGDADIDGDGTPDTTVIKEGVCCGKNCTGDSDKERDDNSESQTTLVSQYFYRTVNLENMFPNTDPNDIAWNWQRSATTSAATIDLQKRGITTYKIDPETTIKNIENTKYVYTDLKNFRFDVTKDNLKAIRSYNKTQNKIIVSNETCSSKFSGFGCSNKFIKNNTYSSGNTDISNGTGIYNNIRESK